MRSSNKMTTTLKYTINESDLVEYKKKTIARQIVTNLVKKGEMKRADKCEICSKPYLTVAHHTDYGKPTDVKWLCNSCHGEVHRKDNPLNPKNITQTMVPRVWEEKDYVNVSFNIPVENFIAIKKLAKETGKSFSKLLRQPILERYPVDDHQLQFNFGENHNESIEKPSKRVQMLEYSKECLSESEQQKVSALWPKRIDLAQGMGKVRELFQGHGGNAKRMQWVNSN